MSTELPGPAGMRPAPGDRDDAAALPGTALIFPLAPGIIRRQRRPGRCPLPDAVAVAVAIRMLAIPDSAPPYDDEAGAGAPAAAAATGIPARPAGAARAAGQTPGPAQAGPQSRIPAVSPGWPGKFAQVLAETLAGARPPRQIAPWTTDRARRHIQRLGPLLAAGDQPRVRRVVTSRPAADVVEMTVIVGVGQRVRALAVRLERDGPRPAGPGRDAQAAGWVCTAIEAA
jgi:hypothetical protein